MTRFAQFLHDRFGITLKQLNGELSLFDDAQAPATPEVNAQTVTEYTLLATDNGKFVSFENGDTITVTVPAGLGAGFNCFCVQLGEGQVEFTSDGTTVNHRQSHTKIAGQFGVASLVAYVANVFVLAGDTAA